jgi:Xaa-Pro aminopeptidase
MDESFQKRTEEFQWRLSNEDVDIAIIYDQDNVYYLSGYWGYLGMQFGRPTLVVVPGSGDCTVITPGLEGEMARSLTWIVDVREWSDGVAGEWVTPLHNLFGGKQNLKVGIERFKMHPLIQETLKGEFPGINIVDVSDILAEMRMIKTPEEIETMRQAGQVAIAMVEGGMKAIAEGVPEYEIALAVISGGTRKAAEFLTDQGPERLFSPMIYNLQVLQSGGPDLSMVHRRPTVRRVQKGEAVYMCFCEMTHFKGFRLGFDRQYWVGAVSEAEIELYEVTLAAQSAALNMIRPGVLAEEVHAAALEVYREAGSGACYRTGRGIGYSLIEKPEFKEGDRTPLQAGMTFAVDGAVSIPGKYATRVGDSIVVTKNGFEYLTPYEKKLRVL